MPLWIWVGGKPLLHPSFPHPALPDHWHIVAGHGTSRYGPSTSHLLPCPQGQGAGVGCLGKRGASPLKGDHSPCACLGHTRPPHLLTRTSGPGGLQGDTSGDQTGVKVEAGGEETVPSCMRTAKSQGLLGFWGHFGRCLSSTPPLGPNPAQGGGSLPEVDELGGRNGFPFLPAPWGAVTFGGALEGPVL